MCDYIHFLPCVWISAPNSSQNLQTSEGYFLVLQPLSSFRVWELLRCVLNTFWSCPMQILCRELLNFLIAQYVLATSRSLNKLTLAWNSCAHPTETRNNWTPRLCTMLLMTPNGTLDERGLVDSFSPPNTRYSQPFSKLAMLGQFLAIHWTLKVRESLVENLYRRRTCNAVNISCSVRNFFPTHSAPKVFLTWPWPYHG